jgi:hypothetical protein
MARARPEHAAPMGLERVLFGVAYYRHVAPTELAAGRTTMRMSRDEQRATDARLQDWPDRAARPRLDPFVGRLDLFQA